MYPGRIRITATLDLLEPLHIGSGETVEYDSVTTRLAESNRDQTREVKINAIVRDVDGNPYIPATTLKGALGAVLGKTPQRAELFGEVVPGNHNESRIGRFWLRGARLSRAPDWNKHLNGLPHACSGDGSGPRHGFIKAQTRIDRETGAAERHKLFQGEMIPVGARFDFTALWLTDAQERIGEDELALFAPALAPLLLVDGLGLGKGRRQGQGRVRLDIATLAVNHERFNPRPGAWEAGDITVQQRFYAALKVAAAKAEDASPPPDITLTLRCGGPYLTINPDRPPRGPTRQPDGEPELIRALRLPDGSPVLWGSSLLGALRAQASWLAELARLRSSDNVVLGVTRPDDVDMDDRDLAKVLPQHRAVRHRDELARLSPVERLFGVAGFRGRLGIGSLKWIAGDRKPTTLTSVSIDRFTGGARDGALFTTEALYGTTFAATLAWDDRGLSEDQKRMDRQFLDDLIEHLKHEGLFLGAGAAKGFGWFTVTKGARHADD